jgi:hypothetical protein
MTWKFSELPTVTVLSPIGTMDGAGGGPDDTVTATALPYSADALAAGFWLMMVPAATVGLLAVVCAPSVSPTADKAVVAAAVVCPVTTGTLTLGSPDDTTSATDEPCTADAPAAGVWLITLPLATVVLVTCVGAGTVNLSAVSALVAATWVWPTTDGTVTITGPSETTKSTAEPCGTEVAAAGFWLITLPVATVALLTLLTWPAVSPAVVRALVAAVDVRPVMAGTATRTEPEESTRLTAVPGLTAAPAAGLWLITLPAGTTELDCVVTVPTVSVGLLITAPGSVPAVASADAAAACTSPARFGTSTVTVMFCVTCGAAGKLALPAWFAAIVQVPAASPLTTAPLIEQVVDVVDVNVTANPDEAVAVTVPVVPTLTAGAEPNVIVCEPDAIVKVWVAWVAAL